LRHCIYTHSFVEYFAGKRGGLNVYLFEITTKRFKLSLFKTQWISVVSDKISMLGKTL
jgi:hypothetical protein